MGADRNRGLSLKVRSLLIREIHDCIARFTELMWQQLKLEVFLILEIKMFTFQEQRVLISFLHLRGMTPTVEYMKGVVNVKSVHL